MLAQVERQTGPGSGEELETATQENGDDGDVHAIDQSCLCELSKEVAAAPEPQWFGIRGFFELAHV
jgi:hypothetical protein